MLFRNLLVVILNIGFLKRIVNDPLGVTVVGGIIVAAVIGVWSLFTKTGKAFWRYIINKISRIKPKVPSTTMRIVFNTKDLRWNMGSVRSKPAMQVNARCYITNIINVPVFILRAYLKKPFVEGTIFVQHPESNYFGNYPILPGRTAEASIDFWIFPPTRGKNEPLNAKIIFVDQYGNCHKTSKLCFSSDFRQDKRTKVNLTPESIYKIRDPIEKTVASILQDELHRYQKHGRPQGGLGSAKKNGTEQKVKSDNEKLLTDYYSQQSEDGKKKIIDNLLLRLSKDKGYSDVGYLILLVLFRLGNFKEALKTAKSDLQGSEHYGFSDFLRLLDMLLEIEHSLFTPDMLDEIESFICGLSENTFQIPERLVSIRARLIKPT